MAESMVAGLFGLTPQAYQNQQYNQDLKRGYELAQLSPGAAAQANLMASAGQLGRGVAGAMGIEDPQLKMISARQQVLGQVDQSDPNSLLSGAKILAQMGDQQGAFALSDFARKAQVQIAEQQQRLAAGRASDAAAKREQQPKTPEKIQIAEYLSKLNLTLDDLIASPQSPERDAEINKVSRTIKALELQFEKPDKLISSGVDRDAYSRQMFNNKVYVDLTPAQQEAVNKRLEDLGVTKARESAAKLTNVLPGDKALADIPAFRASVQRTIDPQLKAVTAADNALENIQDSINTNNFASFRAAQTQFARAISGSGDLSQKELLAAGADPSLLGGTADYLARLFTSTPTLDTQEKIKKTLLAIKKVSTNKAKSEIEAQRKIAYSNPGYDKARVDQALDFSEFSGQQTPTVAGDYAAQARELLKQRQQSKEGKK